MMRCLCLLLIFAVSLSYTSSLERSDDSLICTGCKWFFSTLAEVLDNDLFHLILRKLVEPACMKSYTQDMCDQMYDKYLLLEFQNFFRMVDPIKICPYLSLCNKPKIVPDLRDVWKKQIMRDNPPWVKQRYHIGGESNYKESRAWKMAVVTDPHLDVNYEEGRLGKCKDPVCCRKFNEKGTKPEEKAGPFGFLGPCDLPLRTFESFVNHSAAVVKPDFLVWLGDNSDHAIWNHTKEEYMDPTRIMAQRFQQASYNYVGSMYAVLGNHEGYPCDMFDFENNAHKWVIDETAAAWKQWMTPEAYKEYLKYGSYSMIHPKSKLRIIAINTLAYDTMNSYLWKNNTNPWGILDWLKGTLLKAESNHEAVLILTHMPMNGRFSYIEWTTRYHMLIERFKNIIKGQLHGHTHDDTFQIFRGEDDKRPFATGQTSPSLGTFGTHHPSFRVYYIDKETYELFDYDQYRLYLDEANAKRVANWKLAYRYSTYYNFKNASVESFMDIVNRLIVDKNLTEKYVKMQDTETGKWKNIIKNVTRLEWLRCKLNTSLYNEYDKCLYGDNYTSFLDWFRYRFVQYYIASDWRYAKYD